MHAVQAPRVRPSRPTRPCARRCAAVRSSPPMKPAGRSAAIRTGSGPSPRRTRPRTRSRTGGALRKRPRSSARTMPGAARDGWAPYRQFVHAAHQTCLAHLLRRCRTLLLDHPPHRFAPQVDPFSARARDPRSLCTPGKSRIRARRRPGRPTQPPRSACSRADRVGSPTRGASPPISPPNPTAVFRFLFDPTLDATNWRAEHALRPAVVTRKMCGGGNRTHAAHRPNRSSRPSSAPRNNAASTRPPSSSRRCRRRPPSSSTPFSQLRYTDPLNRDLPATSYRLGPASSTSAFRFLSPPGTCSPLRPSPDRSRSQCRHRDWPRAPSCHGPRERMPMGSLPTVTVRCAPRRSAALKMLITDAPRFIVSSRWPSGLK